MIKNIVFDLGKVLIEVNPVEYLKPFGFDDNTNEELSKLIFHSEEWIQCDAGKYAKNTEIADILCEKFPVYAEKIKLVLTDNWVKMLVRKEETIEFLRELKNRNFKIYILSNLSEQSYQFIKEYDFFELVDGGIYSYEEKLCKPDRKIYKKLLEKYSLIPEETIFIDDHKENIEVAKKMGIYGVIFADLEKVKREVEEMIKLK